MPPDEKTPNPPATFTEEQLNEILEKKLGATVNNMLTARMGTFEKKLTGSIQTMLGETLKTQLPEFLKEFQPAPSKDGEGEGGKNRKGKDDPELATLRQQMAAMANKLAETEARANEIRDRSRTQAIREQVRGFLGKSGIEGDRFDAAYALLAHTGRIVTAEDPNSDEAFFKDAQNADPVVLEVGLGGWLKTDQAKIFLPPNGVRGSGSRPGSKVGNGQPLTAEQQRQAIASALEAELQR
jgi:hypothetical protein